MTNLWITPEELGPYAETEFAYEAAKAASYALWALSGRKFSGITTVTETYVCAARAYRYGASTRNYRAELINGGVYNIQSDTIDFYNDITSDGISPSSRLHLRGTPVTKIHTVRNRAGQVIDPSKYYLVDHGVLQAQPGVAWGPCNLEVTYSYGTEPPTMGKMAARTLAMEFAKLWNNEDDCALPQRVTSISRQGISYTLLDNQDFLQEMRTGIYAIDLFLKSTNPDKARAKAKVFSPDVARARRIVAKPLKYGASDLDIDVTPGTGNSGSVSVSLESLNAQFISDELGWTPYAILRNYTGITTLQLEDAIEVVDPTPSAISLATKSIVDNVAIMTTSAAHGLYVGAEITIAGVGVPFNGTYTVAYVPTTTSFTYAKTNANIAVVASTGTVTSTTDNRMEITVTYDDAVKIIGKYDPGSYDIYASRTNGAETETVYIGTGNVKVALATSLLEAYTVS